MVNLREIEQAIKNRKRIPAEEKVSEEELRKAQASFEKRQHPEYQKIDFFLSARSHTTKPEHTLQEEQGFIIAALQDHRREQMLDWLQDRFSSSYNINKIQELWDNSRPMDNSWNPFSPARDHWILKYHEEVGAHQWQIKDDSTWNEAGDPSDIALQIYENGWIIMARTATDVRGFRI